jgi:uracil-DNA glycosylase
MPRGSGGIAPPGNDRGSDTPIEPKPESQGAAQARGEARFGDFHGHVTVHPSYLLRIPDAAAKQQACQEFCADLAKIRALAS